MTTEFINAVLEAKEARFQYEACGKVEWRSRFETAEKRLTDLCGPLDESAQQPYID